MRIHLAISCILVFAQSAKSGSGAVPGKKQPTDAAAASAIAILREAGELALKQGKEEQFWTVHALLHIGELQIRAGDFEAALCSIRASADPDRRAMGLSHLVEALARSGRKDRATEVSRLLDPDYAEYLQQLVQSCWIEFLLGKGDLTTAASAVKQIKSPAQRRQALQKLAVATAKSGDGSKAAKYFAQSIDAALSLEREVDRVSALSEIAEAQRLLGGIDAAQDTSARLAKEAGQFKDSWAKVSAWRECAVLAVKLKDHQKAKNFFDRAIQNVEELWESQKALALEGITASQADAGLVDDAVKTVSIIWCGEPAVREQALSAVSVAQANGGDTEAAVSTALSIKHFVQYRDDALSKLVEYQIAKRDLEAALKTTEKLSNPSRKAAAILKVATAQAKTGNREAAADIAAGISLGSGLVPKRFDYRRPETWGVCYDSSYWFTMASHIMSVRRAVEVAESAMALALALELKPAQSYAVLFNGFNVEDVIFSLARTHALGDPTKAIVWAKQIGSGRKVPAKDDDHVRWAVERRIYALIGVAEGILDRSPTTPRKREQ